MADTWDDRGQLVGRWDRDARVFVATGWTYGPAGPASVELAPGLRFAVDFADPDVTTEITIEAPLDGDATRLDPRVERAARMLVGPSTLRALLALAEPGAPDRPVTIVEGSRREELSAGMQRRALGRFTLLAEMTTDARSTPLHTVTAGLEAAQIAPRVDPGMGVMLGPARALAREAAATLLALVDAGATDPWTFAPGVDVTAVVRAAVAVLDDEVLARRLGALADRLDHETGARLDLAPAAVPSALRLPAAQRVARRPAMVPPAGVPVEVDANAPDASALLDGTELRVRSPRSHDDERWARVFRRRGHLLLALAPLRRNDLGVDALLVVPSGLDAADLVVDVTAAPETPRPSDTLTAMRAAIAAGRDACRLERLGDTDGAALRWSECADRWDAVGDQRRAALARRRSPSRRRLPAEPFVVDRVV